MDRGYRRYTERRAFVRRLNIVADVSGHWDWMVDPEMNWRNVPIGVRLHRLARIPGYMKEPGYWVHEQMTVPARRREQALLRRVKIGKADPDGVVWPDNRKPHKYYW